MHYVPLRNDLGDLLEQARWLQEHPQEARSIGAAAQAWATRHLSRENVEDYLAKSILSAAREDVAAKELQLA